MTTATINATREVVLILAVNGGWTTIQRGNDEPSKVRNSTITVNPAPSAAIVPVELKKAARVPKAAKGRNDGQDDGDTDDEELEESGSLIKADLAKYTMHDVKTASGSKTLDISDAAADALRGQDISDCYFIVAKWMVKKDKSLDVDEVEADLKARYENLNLGMQRMNLGNKLRKAMGIYGNLNAHKTPRPTKSKAKKAVVTKAKRTTIPKVTRHAGSASLSQ